MPAFGQGPLALWTLAREEVEMNGHDMALALLARGPHADIGNSHNIFMPFAGSWDIEVHDLEGDGARRVSQGEWHFAWVLEGRAMQDVLVVPRRADGRNNLPAKANRCATALRLFDPAEGNWRVFAFNPVAGGCDLMRARMDGKNLLQIGANAQGRALRQTFTDIAGEAFSFRHEIADADGEWQLQAEYFAQRQE
jgi:hypothetical protein